MLDRSAGLRPHRPVWLSFYLGLGALQTLTFLKPGALLVDPCDEDFVPGERRDWDNILDMAHAMVSNMEQGKFKEGQRLMTTVDER